MEQGIGNPLQCSCLENPLNRGAMAGYSPWGCEEIDMTEHACRGEGRVISNSPFGAQLSLATREEDCASQGQPKRKPEIPVVTRESRRNSRKTTWFPPLGKMRPLPATASQGKSRVPP